MSLEATEKHGTDSANRAGELSDDLLASMKVQKRDGTFQISIPKDGARDLGIQKGDSLLWTGAEGDRTLELQTSSAIHADD